MKKRFKKIYIEITNQCNLNCAFCVPPVREPGFIHVDDFRKITRSIKPFTDHICLHVLGEPLLHPDIDLLLDIAGDSGLQVNLTTNGTLLDRWGASILTRPALRQINISLHSKGGYTRDAEIAAYVKQMVGFAEDAVTVSKVIVSFRLWNLGSGSEDDLWFNELVFAEIKQRFHVDINLTQLPQDNSRKGFRIRDRIYLNPDNRFDWPVMTGCVTEEGFCYGLRDQVAILCDGTTVPCCLDSEGTIALGNILHETFEGIIQSERAVKIREGFSSRHAEEELCKRCSYKLRFSE